MEQQELTDIVQLPVIVKSGEIKVDSVDMLKLDEAELKNIANLVGGKIAYMKYRITYSRPEVAFCAHKDCWQLVKHALYCEDHA